jgi:hypothetical protein
MRSPSSTCSSAICRRVWNAAIEPDTGVYIGTENNGGVFVTSSTGTLHKADVINAACIEFF